MLQNMGSAVRILRGGAKRKTEKILRIVVAKMQNTSASVIMPKLGKKTLQFHNINDFRYNKTIDDIADR